MLLMKPLSWLSEQSGKRAGRTGRSRYRSYRNKPVDPAGQSGKLASLLVPLQGLNKAYQVLWMHANGAPTRTVNIRNSEERNT